MPSTSAPDSLPARFFTPALELLPGCSNQRHCPELSDADWLRLGVHRCLQPQASGRGFLQTLASRAPDLCPDNSHFFESLKSQRRLDLCIELNARLCVHARQVLGPGFGSHVLDLPVGHRGQAGGFTALHLAASSGNVEVARLLIAKGAKVNTPSQDGRTPLHFAAGGSSIELLALLLNHQANIDAVQSGHPGKSTPMMYAVQNGRVENLKLLLKRGANLKATFYGVGATALHVAAQQGQVEASKVLLDAGIKIDARDQYQMTPLISAVTAGQRGVAELLIERGADVNASMARNITALQTALGKGDSAMISLLKAHGAKE